MNKGNKRKSDALGMSHGTAANRLRKMIMFSLVVCLKENVCYRCGGEILSEADLSIEHKKAWLQADNPLDCFFDLENVTFSHLSCNVAAAHQPRKQTDEVRKQKLREKEQRRWANRKPDERRKRYEKYGC